MRSDAPGELIERVQRAVVRLVATSKCGQGMLLIGGFRYRLLDRSVRRSRDIDYHWNEDLDAKQQELVSLFRRRLLPALHRETGYAGHAAPLSGPDADSPAVRVVMLALWKPDTAFSRIEIPVEITRVPCADPTEIRTTGGAIVPTLSDADQVESKVLAILGRPVLQHRDLVDLFLFADRLPAEAPRRLAAKRAALGLDDARVRARLQDLHDHAAYHERAILAVVDSQLDPEAAAHLRGAGGSAEILARVRARLSELFPAGGGGLR